MRALIKIVLGAVAISTVAVLVVCLREVRTGFDPQAPAKTTRPAASRAGSPDVARASAAPVAGRALPPKEAERAVTAIVEGAHMSGRIDELEIRRGLATISASYPPEQAAVRSIDFIDKMKRLEADLPNRPARTELGRLADEIRKAPSQAERQNLVGQFRSLAMRLPQIERMEQLAQLQIVSGTTNE